jgi:hypothetical protein
VVAGPGAGGKREGRVTANPSEQTDAVEVVVKRVVELIGPEMRVMGESTPDTIFGIARSVVREVSVALDRHGSARGKQLEEVMGRKTRVLMGESVYEDAIVTVANGHLFIEFEADDLDSIAVKLAALSDRKETDGG